MKSLKLLVVAAMVAATMPAMAQFANAGTTQNVGQKTAVANFPKSYNSLYIGYNPEFLDGKYAYDEGCTFQGLQVGWIGSYSIFSTMPLYLEYGANLAVGFYTYEDDYDYDDDYYYDDDDEDGDVNFTKVAINVPVRLAYALALPNTTTVIRPYTGVNLGFNVYGSASYGDEDLDLFDKKDMGKEMRWNRFQLGWQIGVNFEFNKFVLGLGYQIDFGELYRKCETSKLLITAGFSF